MTAINLYAALENECRARGAEIVQGFIDCIERRKVTSEQRVLLNHFREISLGMMAKFLRKVEVLKTAEEYAAFFVENMPIMMSSEAAIGIYGEDLVKRTLEAMTYDNLVDYYKVAELRELDLTEEAVEQFIQQQTEMLDDFQKRFDEIDDLHAALQNGSVKPE